jgi:bifunctional non-homologous end joining protein LigD
MRTEDHPLEYANFEGVIPEGEYGAGTVMVWDQGTWLPDNSDVDSALRKGDLKFTLHGEKLKGAWALIRTPGYGSSAGRSSWLIIKHRDQYATRRDILVERPYSVLTHRLLAEIARKGGGDVEKAASGDPQRGMLPRSSV